MAQKIAIVTGANKGLGFAIVKVLCEKYDGTVYLTSRDKTRGLKACEDLKKLGFHPFYHQLDVTDNESIKNFIAHIQQKNLVVDILINNAGVLFLKSAPQPKLFQAEQTVFINYTALVNMTEAILPYMKSGGKIVNISSSSGHLCRIPSKELRNKFSADTLTLDELNSLIISYIQDVKWSEEIQKGWGDSPYVVSKVAVNAYTFILHRRLSPKGIKVNCVHPGYVMSDMTLGAGTVSPDDAAAVPATWALSPTISGQYIWHNGTAVPWDGLDPRGYIDGKQL